MPRMMLALAMALACLGMPPLNAMAQSGATPRDPRPVVIRMPQGLPRVQADDPAYVRWREEYDGARRERRWGISLMIVGGGLLGTGLYLAKTSTETRSVEGFVQKEKVTNRGRYIAAGAAILTSFPLFILGGQAHSRGWGAMRRLESEGRRRGYITVAPATEGVGVRVALAF